MKQVKLKIEEFFEHAGSRTVVIDIDTQGRFNELSDAIAEIIRTKIDESPNRVVWLDLLHLKPGETRETTIQSLWELQKSLLKNSRFYHPNQDTMHYEDFFTEEDEFYDP